jgi:hypothetical protein
MFGASWPPFMSSLRANLITVEQLHGSRSSTVIGYGELLRLAEAHGDEAGGGRNERARGALKQRREAKGSGCQVLR